MLCPTAIVTTILRIPVKAHQRRKLTVPNKLFEKLEKFSFKKKMSSTKGARVLKSNKSKKINTKKSDDDSSQNEILTLLNKNFSEMEELRSTLKVVLSKIDELDKNNKILMQNMKDGKKEDEQRTKRLHEYSEKISKIEENQERTDRTARNCQLIIKGSEFSYETENLKVNAINKLSSALHIPLENLKRSDFKLFGKQKKCLLVTTKNNIDRSELFKAARTVKPANISINEFLTPKKAKLIFDLRKLKFEKKKNIHSIFSLSGKVYVTYSVKGDKYEINDVSDLNFTL